MSKNLVLLSYHKASFSPTAHKSLSDPCEVEDKLFISKSIRYESQALFYSFGLGIEYGLEEKGIIGGGIHSHPFDYASDLAKYRSY